MTVSSKRVGVVVKAARANARVEFFDGGREWIGNTYLTHEVPEEGTAS